MSKGAIRQDKATKQWVIFSPSRGKRPHEFRQSWSDRGDLAGYEEDCPFCPGNEHMLSSILLEMSDQGKNPWQTRTIANKFPALIPQGGTARIGHGIYLTMEPYGKHEVIIESPLHNHQIALMNLGEVEVIIETYHRRYLEVMKDERNMLAIIFRNHGSQAGTSLLHPHSQLIVTGMVPHYVRWREEEAQRYFDEQGRCVFCDILNFEEENRERVILENQSFLAFVPFAAKVPFETWIMPKTHQADFGQISARRKSDLASALSMVLRRLYHRLNDPD